MTLNRQKIENYVIIVSLKRETMGKLIKRIPGSRLLILSLPGSALRTHVESLCKPCLVNLISKDSALRTHVESLGKPCDVNKGS